MLSIGRFRGRRGQRGHVEHDDVQGHARTGQRAAGERRVVHGERHGHRRQRLQRREAGRWPSRPFETDEGDPVTVIGDDVNEDNETVLVKLVAPRGRTDRRRSGAGHDHRQERAAVALDQRHHCQRGRRSDVRGRARRQHAAHCHRHLQHERRHGAGARRLHGTARHAHVRPGSEVEDARGDGRRRHHRRADRDLLRQPRRRRQRDDHEEPRHGHDRGQRPGDDVLGGPAEAARQRPRPRRRCCCRGWCWRRGP